MAIHTCIDIVVRIPVSLTVILSDPLVINAPAIITNMLI